MAFLTEQEHICFPAVEIMLSVRQTLSPVSSCETFVNDVPVCLSGTTEPSNYSHAPVPDTVWPPSYWASETDTTATSW